MTPQERQLVDDLFARLSKVESAPRDPDAVAAMAQGLRSAPNEIANIVLLLARYVGGMHPRKLRIVFASRDLPARSTRFVLKGKSQRPEVCLCRPTSRCKLP